MILGDCGVDLPGIGLFLYWLPAIHDLHEEVERDAD